MIILSGALSAMMAVAFGAFGAHGLKNKLPADLMSIYQTAVDYHVYHSLGLLLVGVIAGKLLLVALIRQQSGTCGTQPKCSIFVHRCTGAH